MGEIAKKKEVINQLKKKILLMEGLSKKQDNRLGDFGLGSVNEAFPGGAFPVGTIHEFVSTTESCAAAASGFLSFLVSTFMGRDGFCLWISPKRQIFPPALSFFNIKPHRVIFIDVKHPKEVLWAMEQGLKNKALSVVVAELREVSFAESRRLQLAVENSGATGFLHRIRPLTKGALACISRWKIRPLPSRANNGLPGVGFPRVEVELEKIHGGRPGVWQFEWQNGKFTPVASQKQSNHASSSIPQKPKYA
ncbi:protein ImuA [Mariniphaga anaerophila]|uniref:Protein ImuA n=1 Tax=Mariniphaga anaerophila TaxID=1484053 RepID=A0A1M4VR47_9BACT|nr:hypothetical protein [Mariniphaga anaerophila]SHE71429.1 protein ImuA [Mariniphaga anaerophila]